MKIQRLFPLLLLALSITACKKDDKEKPGPKPPEPPGPDKTHTVIGTPKDIYEWEYKYLTDWYLWPEEVYSLATYDKKLNYQQFFFSMLSKANDGYTTSSGDHQFFSWVFREEGSRSRAGLDTGVRRSGFDFAIFTDIYNFLIIRVDPRSDAAAQGLERGMVVDSVNGEPVLAGNYRRIINSLTETSIQGGTLTVDSITLSTYRSQRVNNREVRVDQKRIRFATTTIDENPILCDTILELADGKKVGYLHYTQFKTGYPEFDDHTYNNQLKAVVGRFVAEGVSDVVLDLRYNSGGATNSSQLLGSLLVPQSKAGQVFSRNEFNASHYPGGLIDPFLTVAQMSTAARFGSAPGASLGLNRLYVIATGNSASASELLMNALEGVDIPVYHIGERTLGKTVGMVVLRAGDEGVEGGFYEDGGVRYRYTLEPVAFRSTNAKGTADYKNGFAPDVQVNEYGVFRDWRNFGDPEELMLSIALSHITTGRFSAQTYAAGDDARRIEVPAPRDRGSRLLLPE